MDIASYIDHTLLKPETTLADIQQLCLEAEQYHFASVCVPPCYVVASKNILKENRVKVCTVIGFPLGCNTMETKIFETSDAVAKGADELDLVIAIAKLKNQQYDEVLQEIQYVREVGKNKILKVIIETALLTQEEKIKACQLAQQAGADFVKTSTGFAASGASLEDVRLMRDTVHSQVGVKASGGIQSLERVLKFIDAGATRIGTSHGKKIIQELQKDSSIVGG